MKGKLRSGYSDSDFDSSDDDDENVEEWIKDMESFLGEEQAINYFNCIRIPLHLKLNDRFTGDCQSTDLEIFACFSCLREKGQDQGRLSPSFPLSLPTRRMAS